MPAERITEIVTVAAVRGAKDAEEILFNEKQQIFSLRTQEKRSSIFAPISHATCRALTQSRPVFLFNM